MSRLIFRSTSGGVERPKTPDSDLDKPISEKALSYLFRCKAEDLEQIALDKEIPRIDQLTKSGKTAIFYNLDNIPDLIEGLKEKVRDSDDKDRFGWLMDVDTSGNTIEIIFPGGSEKLIWSRN
ncbi:hypothetical protein ACFL0F_00845 [Patescibacteria group bacterium]